MNNIKFIPIKNSLIIYAIRMSIPMNWHKSDDFTIKEFNQYKDAYYEHLYDVLDACPLSIEEMLCEKEIQDDIVTCDITKSLANRYKDIVRKEYSSIHDRYIPNKLRTEVLRRDNYKCKYCGVDLTILENTEGFPPHIDHVISKRKGGKNDIENLVASCYRCNLGKKDYDIFEYEDDVEDADIESSGMKETE